MATLHMALLTEAGDLGYKHFVIDGAMRRMTGEAVLLNRRVFPQNRGFFLHVALIALVINRTRIHELIPLGSMRIVA